VHRTGDDLGTILGVWAHPDDEAYLSAGLMARAVAQGRRVVCVTATRGEAGFPDHDTRTITERAALREAELAACLRVLGVTEHHWLDYFDGQCDRVDPDEAAAKIAAIIDEVQPDTVLTFGPDGMTGHVDHIAVSRWTTLAVRNRYDADTARLFYATKTQGWADRFMAAVDPLTVMMVEDAAPPASPPSDLAITYVLDDDLNDRKVEALLCQSSQIDSLVEQTGLPVFRELNREEFFRAVTAADWDEETDE
jgi:LmbE family N-acetylglucosaminyl deacetylase